MLGRTIEYFRIPRNVLTVCSKHVRAVADRQRNALRAGVGRLRHDGNQQHHASPAKIYANEGIAQVLFEADEECTMSYADKKGNGFRPADDRPAQALDTPQPKREGVARPSLCLPRHAAIL